MTLIFKLFIKMDIHRQLKSRLTLWHTAPEILRMKNIHTEIQDVLQEQKQTIYYIFFTKQERSMFLIRLSSEHIFQK